MKLIVILIYTFILTLAGTTFIVCLLGTLYSLAGVLDLSKYVSNDLLYIYTCIMLVLSWYAIKALCTEIDNIKNNKEWTLFKQ